MPEDRLDSWKEIADYLGKGVSTVRRWEREEGLPVRRLEHTKRGSVVAFKHEIDAWISSRTTPLPEAAPVEKPESVLWMWSPAVAVALTGLILAASGDDRAWPEARFVPVTSDAELQGAPGISPDGRYVAFESPTPGQRGIVIQDLETGTRRQLTETADSDSFPRWSPDGSKIVFSRIGRDSRDVMIVASSGGEPKQVFRRPIAPTLERRHEWASWTADGKELLIPDQRIPGEPWAIFRCAPESGTCRPVTTPPRGSFGDTHAAASPDGELVAFVRFGAGNASDIYVADLAGGAPRRLTSAATHHLGLGWTPDSRAIVFSTAGVNAFAMLGRVSAKGGAAPEPILGVSGDAHWPSISVRGPLRIAYQWRSETTNIIRWDLASNHTAAVAPSLRFDANPQLSPDESKVAFASDRDGFRELWIVNADGSSPKRLTNLRRPFTDSPRWSPDGKTIAFSTTEGENREIYTMPSEGGEIRRITNSPSEEGRPSWSADGKFIYFRSDLGGTKNIWRVPAAGGSPEQLTRKGGYEAFASADRKWIYFAKDRAELGLWRIPAAGGAEEKISDEIREGQWGLAVKSVWYLKPKPEWGLWRLDLETRRAELAAPMEPRQRIYSGMTVNANGTAILYSKAVAQNSDVALLEFAKP